MIHYFIAAAVDKAYSDFNIASRCLTGFDVDVFGSIGEQVRMANEARSHLFIRPTEADRSALQKVTTDALPAEIQGQKNDDEPRNDRSKVDKQEPRERCYSPRQPLSRVDRKSKSQRVRGQSGIKRIDNLMVEVDTGANKREVKVASKADPSTVVSTQGLSRDDHPSKMKSTEKQILQVSGRNECDLKSDMSKRERDKKAGTSTDVQQQRAVENTSAGNSENKVKKLSERRYKKKVASYSNTESCQSSTKSDDHKVKSVISRPSDKVKAGSGGRKLPGDGDGFQKSPVTVSADEITRMVQRSFDEVHLILYCFLRQSPYFLRSHHG